MTDHDREEGLVMKAAAGDRLVVEGTHGAGVRRIGVIMGLRDPDGTPPYVVRWVDDEHEGLVFPGPDARVVTKEDRDVSFTTS
ncbi:DUF1918 domain-containing protein [Planomonospora parontospora]|uniref:DUF1918 domain-containing protein n=1 Tax=Planomonospora parontospora TaxID=58119 RepID=UPI00198E6D83|nr:DUF1918 domain-containing protein [Planomonospora parontospora]GGL13961.1 hypothetical protein GCM10014719_14860 [Planomonospora parontospora subsp. antibiotica]GII17898.1 hypothetical protein Ppa05_46240 [Planomonospora parontospora subsp. antibiotica]